MAKSKLMCVPVRCQFNGHYKNSKKQQQQQKRFISQFLIFNVQNSYQNRLLWDSFFFFYKLSFVKIWALCFLCKLVCGFVPIFVAIFRFYYIFFYKNRKRKQTNRSGRSIGLCQVSKKTLKHDNVLPFFRLKLW